MHLSTLHPSTSMNITPAPLDPPAFSPFGTAIVSPLFQAHNKIPLPPPSPAYRAHQPSPIVANQSTALKYPSISPLVNTYPPSSSSAPQMSLFACFPRPPTDHSNGFLSVKILERHPYTTQTFTPLNLSPSSKETRYLVIVAPSLSSPGTDGAPINPPDLNNIHAFIATGGQAVTYAAGTWHAPMIVLGRDRVEFVVTQFVNGIADDDCQEVLVGEGVKVDIREVFGPKHHLESHGSTTALIPLRAGTTLIARSESAVAFPPSPPKFSQQSFCHPVLPLPNSEQQSSPNYHATEELEASLRKTTRHLHAEKQLTATLEEALIDLEATWKSDKAEKEEWKIKAKAMEAEIEALRRERWRAERAVAKL